MYNFPNEIYQLKYFIDVNKSIGICHFFSTSLSVLITISILISYLWSHKSLNEFDSMSGLCGSNQRLRPDSYQVTDWVIQQKMVKQKPECFVFDVLLKELLRKYLEAFMNRIHLLLIFQFIAHTTQISLHFLMIQNRSDN